MKNEMKSTGQVNLETARRVLEVVDAGLVRGKGAPKPGEMCVEAAVCYALGQPHGDRPTCVHKAVRNIKISINDSRWSSNKARAEGLRRVAIAQLGTADTLDEDQFKREFRIAATARAVPLLLDAAAGIARRNKDGKQAAKIKAVAEMCRRGMAPDVAQAEMRALHPRADANAYAYAYTDTDAYADAYAYAYAYADAYADAYAYANTDADAYAYADAYTDAYARDKFLRAVADSVEAALRTCKSPGIALLDELIPATT